MPWNSLKNCLGKALSSLPETPIKITKNIYQSGPAYLVTANHFRDLSPSEEPIISLVVWAPSPNALRRAFDQNIEEDDGVLGIPPEEMLLAQRANTWESIQTAAKQLGIKFLESASYRITTDGAFIHKQLESRTYRVYFRSRHINPNEHPYAIVVSA